MSTCTKRCLLLLEKCKNMKHLKQSHAQAITCGLGDNSFALSRLLAFCSDPLHGSPSYGWKIFQHIEKPTICICNTMIKAFLLSGELNKTIEIYTHMLRNGMLPDNYTLPYVLKACASMRTCNIGESVHGHCLKLGFLFDSFVGNGLIFMYSAFDDMGAARCVFDEVPWHCVVSWTLLISGYSKIGDVENARQVFDETPVKDIGIWGCMISGYVQNSCFKEGLHLFRLMQLTGVEPDEAIFVSILCACAHLGALYIGIWIHRYLEHVKYSMTVRLGTALMDMYAKCGYLDLAEKVFDEMPQRDTICWNAMISGWAIHGDGDCALRLFSEMEKAGIKPDDITFIAVFTACSYSGMAYEGLRVLSSMCNAYLIEPKSEHYGCVIDFLGRAGLLEEAKEIIERMPDSSCPSKEAVAWRALMSACCSHGNIRLAEVAADKLLQLERHSGAYVLLSNLYSSAGKHNSARKLRRKMKTRGLYKTPGCSSVEINGNVHEFIAGEETHPRMEDVHVLLESVTKHLDSFVCDLHLVST
ncbi:Pentatricopeptide repeat-containing protein [Actinidia chinensis var. chinensis]|uniref:Pentatricopeptide repeat-containing protein n=1 Tax=Actinidia chinensis var. chinensis TaxID=1590841 RepID=A0A2R6PBM0_ACTCC|nr:Pentatricopeptide repeat-containing protein [Actinidia chinensis var. chinensis]